MARRGQHAGGVKLVGDMSAMMDPDQLPERVPLDIPEPPVSHNGASGVAGPAESYPSLGGVVEPAESHPTAPSAAQPAEPLLLANGVADTTEPDVSAVTVERLPHRSFPHPSISLPARLRVLSMRRRFDPRQRRWVRIASAALLLILVAVLALVVVSTRAAVTHYAKIRQGNLTVSFGASGVLQTATYGASFAGSGVVKEIDVTVGQTVNQGDPIAKLDTTLLQDAYNEAQTAVSNAQTALNDAQNNLQAVQAQSAAQATAAYDTEQSAINACKANDGTCVQNAQDAYASAQAQENHNNAVAQQEFDTAQSALNIAQAHLQTAQDNLNGAVLTAPHSGTISAINGSVGNVVAGMSAATPSGSFVQIADLNSLQVQTSIGVNHISGVMKGNAVQISVPVVGSQTYLGAVDAVSPIGANNGGALTYPVTIDLAPQDGVVTKLLPGMKANVVITTAQRVGVLLIPASAVAFASAAADRKHGGFLTAAQTQAALTRARNMALDLQNSGTDVSQDSPTPAFVLQYVKNKWIVQPVVLGLTDGTSYEVLAMDLTVGDSIVSGQANSSVKIPKPTPTLNS